MRYLTGCTPTLGGRVRNSGSVTPPAGRQHGASAHVVRVHSPVRMCGSKTVGLHTSSWYTVTLYDVGRPTPPVSELSGTVLIKASAAPLHKVGRHSRPLRGPDRRVQLLSHTTVSCIQPRTYRRASAPARAPAPADRSRPPTGDAPSRTGERSLLPLALSARGFRAALPQRQAAVGRRLRGAGRHRNGR